MIQNRALTGKVITSAETLSGAMINASASAEAAADISDECLRSFSKQSVTWEGEAFLAMVDCEFSASVLAIAPVNSMAVKEEVRF